MLTGTNLVYTKQFNIRIVHEVIRLFGPLSRADIARRTRLTVQTVSNLVKELIAAGLIYEAERRQEGRGAPSTTLALNPEGAYAIGLDLDRDHRTGVLVDLAGAVRQRVHVDIEFPTPEEALELLVEAVDTLICRQGLTRSQVWGVGVGIPGPMHPGPDGEGYVVNPKAFPGWHEIPLAEWLQERLQMPIFLENNATAAAVGERWYGGAQQIPSFFYTYFGDGLGGGFVMKGQPYEGATGNAGEIGYLPTELAGGAERNGDSAHVGQHFFMPSLYQSLRDDGEDACRPEDLGRLMKAGNPRLLRWIDDAADRLTGIVLAVEYLIDPDAIIFGGRLPDNVLAALIDRVAARLPSRRIGEKTTAPRHLLATAGADAVALGVATLPIYDVIAPAHQVLMKQSRGRPEQGLRRSRALAVG